MDFEKIIKGFGGKLNEFFNGKKGDKPTEDRKTNKVTRNIKRRESEDDDDFDDLDDDDDDIEGDLDSKRPETLELLGIKDVYDIPDDVLAPGDFSDIKFTITRPEGYSQKEVDEYFRMTRRSAQWYYDKLHQRDKDIAQLGTQVDKMDTDLHNMKLQSELAAGLSVMTGQQGEYDKELMEYKLKVSKLNDYIDKKNKEGSWGSDPEKNSKRFDEIQNQLALAQMENKKLRASVKDLKLKIAEISENAPGLIGGNAPVTDDDELNEKPLRSPVTTIDERKTSDEETLADEDALPLPNPDAPADGDEDDAALPALPMPSFDDEDDDADVPPDDDGESFEDSLTDLNDDNLDNLNLDDDDFVIGEDSDNTDFTKDDD